jgi:hypothetical protein
MRPWIKPIIEVHIKPTKINYIIVIWQSLPAYWPHNLIWKCLHFGWPHCWCCICVLIVISIQAWSSVILHRTGNEGNQTNDVIHIGRRLTTNGRLFPHFLCHDDCSFSVFLLYYISGLFSIHLSRSSKLEICHNRVGPCSIFVVLTCMHMLPWSQNWWGGEGGGGTTWTMILSIHKPRKGEAMIAFSQALDECVNPFIVSS